VNRGNIFLRRWILYGWNQKQITIRRRIILSKGRIFIWGGFWREFIEKRLL